MARAWVKRSVDSGAITSALLLMARTIDRSPAFS